MLLLFGPFLVGGRVLWGQDIGRVYYPITALLQRVLRTGDVSPLLWNPDLAAGFPLVADGAATPFYPPQWALLLCFTPERALTAGLLLAYLGAALAMAGFARALGLRRPAAAVAGLVYSCSGFAIGHSVHVNVVAGLPFLPLVLLCLERSAKAATRRHVTLAGLAWGVLCLGGHPQVAAMTAALGVGYALFRFWPARADGRALARPARLVALFLAVGAGVSAIYYWPMAELAGVSVRAGGGGLSAAQAAAYSLPGPHFVTAVSPFFFFDARPGSDAYWGAWNPAEMALYAGVSTLVLAALALLRLPRDPFVRFFAGLAGLSALLALGDATPLHAILHALPVFGSLRGPARYVLLLDVALAVLAAIGLDSMLRDEVKHTRVARVIGLAALLACGLPLLESLWRGQLTQDGWRDAAWAIGVPPLLLVKSLLPPTWLALTGLWLWRKPRHPTAWWPAAGVVLVAVDLFAFAATTLASQWVRPETVIGTDATRSLGVWAKRGRVYVLDSPEPWRGASNLSLVHGLPSLTAYVSLPLARYAAYTRAFWLSGQSAHGLLDAAGVRLVVDAWQRPLSPRLSLDGEQFSPRHPIAAVGSSPRERRFRFALPDAEADRIRLVSAVRGGKELEQDDAVARLTLRSGAEAPLSFELRVGRDTAEGVHDSQTAHTQPALRVNAWSLVDRPSEGTFYLTELSWPTRRRVHSVELEYLAPQGRLLVFGGSVGTLQLSPFMSDGYRRLREENGAVLYENTRALPRAFAVHRVVHAANSSGAIQALAGGTVAPASAVVIEDPGAPSPTGSGPSTVTIERDEPLRVDLSASMTGDGYVVLADTNYPGWQATLDDVATPIHAANGLFRAVFVPAGPHRVSFQYTPWAVYRGALLSAVTLALATVLVLGRRPRVWRNSASAAGER